MSCSHTIHRGTVEFSDGTFTAYIIGLDFDRGVVDSRTVCESEHVRSSEEAGDAVQRAAQTHLGPQATATFRKPGDWAVASRYLSNTRS